jgi:general secretion pathway protein I
MWQSRSDAPQRTADRPTLADAGFSVVEALVALAVFAMAGVALVQLQAHSVATLTRVEARALASVVAQNKLVDAYAATQAPDLGASEGEARLGGRDWRWRMAVSATADPMTRRVAIDVREARGGDPLAQAYAFVSVSGAAR